MRSCKKSDDLQVLFWVYGLQDNNGKARRAVEYNFHQQDGRKARSTSTRRSRRC